MQLVIGNKNYSSWSMRPWVLMRHFNLPFQEVLLRFGDHDFVRTDSAFKQAVLQVSPAGRVPVLVDGDLVVWDTLAIAETLAERHPQQALWPRDAKARARARSLCCEMHSGFGALRSTFPMNIEFTDPLLGARLLQEKPAAAADLQRLAQAFGEALASSGGPFLFGEFGIADAYFAPVIARVRGYGLPLPAPVQAWADRVWALPAVQAWVQDALAEHEFVPQDEPYRNAPAWR